MDRSTTSRSSIAASEAALRGRRHFRQQLAADARVGGIGKGQGVAESQSQGYSILQFINERR
eukprot:6194735-Pleurochrysis_carterae.AAC.1